jgi:hypothetical protein
MTRTPTRRTKGATEYDFAPTRPRVPKGPAPKPRQPPAAPRKK